MKTNKKKAQESVRRQKTIFEDNQHCLHANDLEKKINRPEKNKRDVDCLRKNFLYVHVVTL